MIYLFRQEPKSRVKGGKLNFQKTVLKVAKIPKLVQDAGLSKLLSTLLRTVLKPAIYYSIFQDNT